MNSAGILLKPDVILFDILTKGPNAGRVLATMLAMMLAIMLTRPAMLALMIITIPLITLPIPPITLP